MAFRERRSYISEFHVAAYLKDGHFTFLAHWHTEVELVYVIEGSFKMGISQNVYTLEPGDIAICGSGDIHFFGGGAPNTKAVILVFDPKIIGSLRGWPDHIYFPSPLIKAQQFVVEQNDLQHAFLRAYTEYTNRRSGWEMLFSSEINKICGLLIRSAGKSTVQNTVPIRVYEGSSKVSTTQVMQDVIRYIEQKYIENLTLEQTAKFFNVSPFYFSRVFNQTVGMNFRTYINYLRVARAEQMIADTDLSLLAVSLDCGFGSVRSFNRIFKSIMGIPPSALRTGEKD